MNPLSVVGQVVGLVAAAAMITSFQFKDNKKLFAIQVVSGFLFTLHFMFLGLGGQINAYAGMAQNFGGLLFRVLLLLSEKYEKLKSPLALTVLCAYCAVVAAITFDPNNIICILPMIGNIIGMGAMWTRKPNVIRIEEFTVTSPCWMIYNISTFSISGILTEIFNIVSIGVYYLRMLIRNKKNRKTEETEPTDEKS